MDVPQLLIALNDRRRPARRGLSPRLQARLSWGAEAGHRAVVIRQTPARTGSDESPPVRFPYGLNRVRVTRRIGRTFLSRTRLRSTGALLTKAQEPPCVHHPSSVSIGPFMAKSRAQTMRHRLMIGAGTAKDGNLYRNRLAIRGAARTGPGICVSIARLTAAPPFTRSTTTCRISGV